MTDMLNLPIASAYVPDTAPAPLPDKCCYFNNGLSMRWVAPDYATQKGEVLFPGYATADELRAAFGSYGTAVKKEAVTEQIAVLEAKQTPRRIREAVAGVDGGWLDELNAEIERLRAQL